VTNGPSGGCSSASPAGKCALFCSDSDGVYPLVLAVGNHHQGKGETVALERNNRQQRHWTAALRRRSIVVSKSLAMIERRVALFAHLHVNKEAAPEMYRLPILTITRIGVWLT
jgi:insertion element IS1 protein InsB